MMILQPAPPDSFPRSPLPGSTRLATVWVLDDSPLEGEMARRVLESDYQVEVFTDSAGVLERLAAGAAPDALVLDWHMPGISGFEICRYVRTARDAVELPILMLTVHGHKPDVVEALELGANDYVTKPYDGAELIARVRAMVRTRELHERARAAERARAVEHELLKRAQAEAEAQRARAETARHAAEEANRVKDDFLAMVSHELRTPLNAMLGWTRMLRAGTLPPDRRERALETIERNAQAQAQLVDDLLDVSRIMAGKLRLDVQPVSLPDIVDAALEAVRPAADARGVALVARVAPHRAPDVHGDPARLQQVIWNLLYNAIKFTPRGGRVEVALARAGDHLELRVTDTGQGIAKEFLPHVFERFRQGAAGASRAHGGLGLGLAIVRHLVELHGGSVHAQSEGAGRGATFVVRLPEAATAARRERRPALSAAPAALAEIERPGEIAGRRVLVVDDEADARELLVAVLEQCGAVVVATDTASAALEALNGARYDVIVSDIGMPNDDGYMLVRSVRAMPAARGGRTPMVALTGYARVEDRTRALRAGFDMHIPKPIDVAELLAVVANLAGRAGARE